MIMMGKNRVKDIIEDIEKKKKKMIKMIIMKMEIVMEIVLIKYILNIVKNTRVKIIQNRIYYNLIYFTELNLVFIFIIYLLNNKLFCFYDFN